MPGKKGGGHAALAGKAAVAPHVVKVRLYPLVVEAIENSVSAGIRKLWKYHDGTTMTEEQMEAGAHLIVDYVLNGLCELVELDPED